MKKSLLLLCAFVALVAQAAAPVKIGDIYYELKSGSECSVAPVPDGETPYTGDIVIPGSVTDENEKSYTVTSINQNSFNSANIQSVNIPNSVMTIGANAFAGCSNLQTVTFASLSHLCNIVFNNISANPLSADNAQLAFADGTGTTDITVSQINKNTFAGYKKELNVTVAEGLEEIPDAAFQNSAGLKSISIPSSVTKIGINAFSGCTGLSAVTFVDVTSLCNIDFAGTASNPLSAGNAQLAFADGDATNVVVPNTIKEIKKYAFYGYKKEFNITLSEGVEAIQNNAFTNCDHLTSVDIPSTVTTIGSGAFSGCRMMKSVTLRSGYANVAQNAFKDCSQINQVKFASVQSLCRMAFSDLNGNPLAVGNNVELSFVNDDNAENLTIPEGVTIIKKYTFYGCKQLKSLTISQDVKTIEASAFSGCSGLTSVSIPEGMETIETNAFNACTGLSKVSYASEGSLCSISYASASSNPLSYAHHLFVGNSETYTIFIPAESLENGVKIRNYILCGASYITRVNIPADATTIGTDAFKGCINLAAVGYSSISQLNSMTYENADANPLQFASSLIVDNSIVKGITIDDEEVKKNAFFNATWLEEVTLSDNVKRIGESAFSGCANLRAINLEKVEQIGDYAFKSCAMPKVAIAEGCTLGEYVFNSCKNLADVTLPESLTALPKGTFTNCESLTSVKFSSSLTSIGQDAFKSCYSLRTLPVSNSVKTINPSAFENCTKLTAIVLGDDQSGQVESIGQKAFYNCTAVTMVSLPATINDIYENAFGQCTKLKEVHSFKSVAPATTDELAFGGNETSMKLYVVDQDALSSYSNTLPWKKFGEKNARRLSTLTFYINNVKIDEWDLTLQNGYTISDEEIALRTPALAEGEAFSGWDKAIPQAMPYEDMRFDGYITTELYVGDIKLKLYPERNENGVVASKKAVLVGVKKLDSDKDLNVPATVAAGETEYPVTEIAENGFDYNEPLQEGEAKSNDWKKYIKSITLPNSITVIGANAFLDCKEAASINIPESVDSIGDYAFQNCYRLSAITIPSTLRILGKGAFKWCAGLETVDGFNKEEIADETFYGCSHLYAIQLSQVKKLGNAALANCSSLELDELPAGLVTIGNQALSGTGIRNAVIGKEVSLGDAVFKGCTKLVTATFEEGFAKPLPSNTFAGCTTLNGFTLASGMGRVGEGAFKGCTALTAISEDMLKGITSIGTEAFSGCKKLTTVKLPQTLERLASKAFADCDTLIQIFALNNNVPESTSDVFGEKTYQNDNAYVYVNDDAAVETYKAKEPWKNFKNADDTYRIIVARNYKLTYKLNGTDYRTFDDVMVGTPINVLDAPKDADREDRPFSGWYTVDANGKQGTVPGVMPQKDTVIVGKFKYEVKFYEGTPKDDDSNRLLSGEGYEEGFWYWYGDSYSLPAEMFKREDKRFTISIDDQTYNDDDVANLTLEMSDKDVNVIVNYQDVVAEMAEEDISYKIMLDEGTAAVKEIKANMQAVVIPATIKYEDKDYTVTSILPNACKHNNRITSITLNNVSTIGDDAFYRCLSLSEIKGGLSKVDSIGNNAFCGTLLTEVTLPANVTKMGKSVFYGCSHLQKAKVEAETVREETFAKCGSYSSTGELAVTLFGVKTIGDKAFDGCSKIKNLSIPTTVTRIGEYAFDHVFEKGDVIEVLAASADAFPAIAASTFDEDAYSEVELRTQKIGRENLPEYWKNFKNIGEIVQQGAKQCQTPTISYQANKLTLACQEEGATIFYTIKALDAQSASYNPETGLTLGKVFEVTAQAKKSGMMSSDIVTETFNFEYGDLNGDGLVNVQDILLVLKRAAGQVEPSGNTEIDN